VDREAASSFWNPVWISGQVVRRQESPVKRERQRGERLRLAPWEWFSFNLEAGACRRTISSQCFRVMWTICALITYIIIWVIWTRFRVPTRSLSSLARLSFVLVGAWGNMGWVTVYNKSNKVIKILKDKIIYSIKHNKSIYLLWDLIYISVHI
jgi:hypothetical protein